MYNLFVSPATVEDVSAAATNGPESDNDCDKLEGMFAQPPNAKEQHQQVGLSRVGSLQVGPHQVGLRKAGPRRSVPRKHGAHEVQLQGGYI